VISKAPPSKLHRTADHGCGRTPSDVSDRAEDAACQQANPAAHKPNPSDLQDDPLDDQPIHLACTSNLEAMRAADSDA
jgi:hypothetical protein